MSWTDIFGEALCELAARDPRVVAITAAMASSTGLLEFAERFPDRFFDVGIAEQHGVTFAAGLALRGMRPVVCIYSTFLQRAFDQVTCDVALHRLPVMFVLDRAGITGPDGPSHHGTLDLAYLRTIPGMVVAAPSTPEDLRRMLATGLELGAPFALRYPKGSAPVAEPAPLQPITVGQGTLLRDGNDVLLVAVGRMVGVASAAADRLAAQGVSATVFDARFVKPLDPEIATLAARHRGLCTVEDGTAIGGLGSAVCELLEEAGVTVPVRRLGLPDHFIEQGDPPALLARFGLDASGVSAAALEVTRTVPARVAG
jgi:1-deoxy-D-xylulose-5-phosphate synthase